MLAPEFREVYMCKLSTPTTCYTAPLQVTSSNWNAYFATEKHIVGVQLNSTGDINELEGGPSQKKENGGDEDEVHILIDHKRISFEEDTIPIPPGTSRKEFKKLMCVGYNHCRGWEAIVLLDSSKAAQESEDAAAENDKSNNNNNNDDDRTITSTNTNSRRPRRTVSSSSVASGASSTDGTASTSATSVSSAAPGNVTTATANAGEHHRGGSVGGSGTINKLGHLEEEHGDEDEEDTYERPIARLILQHRVSKRQYTKHLDFRPLSPCVTILSSGESADSEAAHPPIGMASAAEENSNETGNNGNDQQQREIICVWLGSADDSKLRFFRNDDSSYSLLETPLQETVTLDDGRTRASPVSFDSPVMAIDCCKTEIFLKPTSTAAGSEGTKANMYSLATPTGEDDKLQPQEYTSQKPTPGELEDNDNGPETGTDIQDTSTKDVDKYTKDSSVDFRKDDTQTIQPEQPGESNRVSAEENNGDSDAKKQGLLGSEVKRSEENETDVQPEVIEGNDEEAANHKNGDDNDNKTGDDHPPEKREDSNKSDDGISEKGSGACETENDGTKESQCIPERNGALPTSGGASVYISIGIDDSAEKTVCGRGATEEPAQATNDQATDEHVEPKEEARPLVCHHLAVACQDGTIRFLQFEWSSSLEITFREEYTAIVDGPIIGLHLNFDERRMQLEAVAGSLCGYVARFFKKFGSAVEDWKGPFMVAEGFWNSRQSQEDSVLTVHAWDGKVAVGTFSGRCLLYGEQGNKSKDDFGKPYWDCQLPDPVNGICHIPSASSVLLLVTTRLSIHVFQEIPRAYFPDMAKRRLQFLMSRSRHKLPPDVAEKIQNPCSASTNSPTIEPATNEGKSEEKHQVTPSLKDDSSNSAPQEEIQQAAKN